MASPSRPPAPPPRAERLVDVLRQLPDAELDGLVQRLRIAIDGAKRIDGPSQVARALVMLPEVRDPSVLNGPTRELLFRVAEARGSLVVSSLPAAVGPLVARGVVFAREQDEGIELLLPIAFMLQLRSWEGEDPRGARALLAQANQEVASAIASHYLGRPATHPLSISLEAAWEALSNPERLSAEIEALAPMERKLLRAVEKVGGEVDTQELLELEREPLRLRGATGATPSRRGVGFALERRGFLIPVHPNRHVIPTEVASIVGAARRAEREALRREIHSRVLGEDFAPHRARFAVDPTPLALAMAIGVRDPALEVRPGVGTPKSLLTKLATRFGRSLDDVALIAALSRAAGLWDPSVVSVAAPPGSLRVAEVGRSLFGAWRRGGAWDEARPDGETLRVAAEQREASPVGVVREMVLDALGELGDGHWAPAEALAAYVRADSRAGGIARLLERWAARAGVPAMTPEQIARRIAVETLHVLGVVDLGEPDPDGEYQGELLRITPSGRLWLADRAAATDAPCTWVDSQVLRVGPGARVGHLLGCGPFLDIVSVGGELDLALTSQTLALAVAAGFDTDAVRARLTALGPIPDPVERVLNQAGAVVGRAEFVTTQGFLWVDDPEIRSLLATRRQTSDLFLDPSPPGGLLVAEGVDLDRLARRLRGLGVELVVEGTVYRTRSMGGATRTSSSSLQAVTGRRQSATRARTSKSSGNVNAVKRGD